MPVDPHAPEPDAAGEQRHLPVLVPEAAATKPAGRAPGALTRPLAAATGGVLAGMATMVLLRLLRGGGRRGGVLRVRRRGGRATEVAATRSFLVDVHFLKR